MNNNKKILLTGATGFLGRHTRPVLEQFYGPSNIVSVSSSDYNLMSRSACESMFNDIAPDVVVHYAAYSGGISANRAKPADFYYQNTLLTANVFDVAAKFGIHKMIYPMGGCSYPAKAISPIDEGQLWSGYPQEESAGYSTAKMMGLVAAKSYETQYGLKTTVIIPGNMYGEYDNFNRLESHVVPAMIRRYYEANLDGNQEVYMWGTGSPERDFVYAGDVANMIPYFIDKFDEVGPINISSGVRTPIKTLAEQISLLVNFSGKIYWDASKPDGQKVKIFDVTALKQLGLVCQTPLSDGLKKTIDWFSNNYKERSDGIRL